MGLGEGGWVTEQLGTAHPKLTKAERRHDACYRCGSESGEGKVKGKKKGLRAELCKKKQTRSHGADMCCEGCQDVWES